MLICFAIVCVFHTKLKRKYDFLNTWQKDKKQEDRRQNLLTTLDELSSIYYHSPHDFDKALRIAFESAKAELEELEKDITVFKY